MANVDATPTTTLSHQSPPVAPRDDVRRNETSESPTTIGRVTENLRPVDKSSSIMEHPAVARAADLSDPTSKEATPNSSTRDESQSEAATYSTRSRNRSSTARPNYADDVEMDFEIPIAKHHVRAEKRRSGSAEVATQPVTARESKGPTIRLYTNANSADGAPKASTSTKSAKPAVPSATVAPVERKKRKYERHTVAHAAEITESRSAPGAPKDIPGTSQFFATPNGDTQVPPPKKRKTGDDVAKNTNTSQVVRHGPRETCMITFENNGLIVKDGKLVADDGSTYSANGEFRGVLVASRDMSTTKAKNTDYFQIMYISSASHRVTLTTSVVSWTSTI